MTQLVISCKDATNGAPGIATGSKDATSSSLLGAIGRY